MSAVRFYVPVFNYRAKPQVTTGFAATHPVHNCLDFNLDSYAYPSTAAHSITIDIDANFGTYLATQYTFVAVWLANYEELNQATYLDIKLETSTDAAFTSPTDHGTKTCNGDTYLPLVLWQLGASCTDRYVRLTYSSSVIKAKTAMVCWGISYDLTYKHEWQQTQAVEAMNAVDEMGAGRLVIRNFRSHMRERYRRFYRMMSDADLGYLKLVHAHARGRWMPIIVRDDPDTTLDKDCKVIRLAQDHLEWTPVQYDLNDVMLEFAEVPYTQDTLEW